MAFVVNPFMFFYYEEKQEEERVIMVRKEILEESFDLIPCSLANSFGSEMDHWISYFSDCFNRSRVYYFLDHSIEIIDRVFYLEYSFLNWQHYLQIIRLVNGIV